VGGVPGNRRRVENRNRGHHVLVRSPGDLVNLCGRLDDRCLTRGCTPTAAARAASSSEAAAGEPQPSGSGT
jgi:hypothetical protein